MNYQPRHRMPTILRSDEYALNATSEIGTTPGKDYRDSRGPDGAKAEFPPPFPLLEIFDQVGCDFIHSA